ncbi:MAG TPA: Ku protein, partial [Acidobacteriaceae bacterium]|nr:Ku protein [Acidobacteriaceae bacterium]
DRAEIDPVWFDSSYYVVPDGEAGQDVFVVLRDAIAETGRAALSRVVMARRERAVALLPMGKGLVCHTLHEPRDLYSSDTLFEGISDAKPDPEMVKLATQLIERQEGRFEPEDSEDRYETRLREVIQAKLKGEGITPPQEEKADRGNVIDLMSALKASLGREDKAAEETPAARRPSQPAQSKAKKTAPKKAATRKRA